jgi:hypothetical protein
MQRRELKSAWSKRSNFSTRSSTDFRRASRRATSLRRLTSASISQLSREKVRRCWASPYSQPVNQWLANFHLPNAKNSLAAPPVLIAKMGTRRLPPASKRFVQSDQRERGVALTLG